jgi:hypothetical protein
MMDRACCMHWGKREMDKINLYSFCENEQLLTISVVIKEKEIVHKLIYEVVLKRRADHGSRAV